MIRITAFNLGTKQFQSATVVFQSGSDLSVDFGDGIYQRIVANPMTEKQYRYLVDLGVNVFGHETTLTKRQASILIDAAKVDDLESTGFERLESVSLTEPIEY